MNGITCFFTKKSKKFTLKFEGGNVTHDKALSVNTANKYNNVFGRLYIYLALNRITLCGNRNSTTFLTPILSVILLILALRLNSGSAQMDTL